MNYNAPHPHVHISKAKNISPAEALQHIEAYYNAALTAPHLHPSFNFYEQARRGRMSMLAYDLAEDLALRNLRLVCKGLRGEREQLDAVEVQDMADEAFNDVTGDNEDDSQRHKSRYNVDSVGSGIEEGEIGARSNAVADEADYVAEAQRQSKKRKRKAEDGAIAVKQLPLDSPPTETRPANLLYDQREPSSSLPTPPETQNGDSEGQASAYPASAGEFDQKTESKAERKARRKAEKEQRKAMKKHADLADSYVQDEPNADIVEPENEPDTELNGHVDDAEVYAPSKQPEETKEERKARRKREKAERHQLRHAEEVSDYRVEIPDNEPVELEPEPEPEPVTQITDGEEAVESKEERRARRAAKRARKEEKRRNKLAKQDNPDGKDDAPMVDKGETQEVIETQVNGVDNNDGYMGAEMQEDAEPIKESKNFEGYQRESRLTVDHEDTNMEDDESQNLERQTRIAEKEEKARRKAARRERKEAKARQKELNVVSAAA